VKAEITSNIVSAKQNGVSLNLITRINLQSFHKRASDVDALNAVLDASGTVYNCSNLHAKVYIFDDEHLIITSANVTNNGLRHNLECGIISSDVQLVKDAVASYSEIIHEQEVGRIDRDKVAAINDVLRGIPSLPRVEYPQLDLSTVFDGDLAAITNTLTGWKLSLFEELNVLGSTEFDSNDAKTIASRLSPKYPNNHNIEAKVRQHLQELRDLGLVEFTSRGRYKKLWVNRSHLINLVAAK
jgi:DpnI-like restriction endonuclease/phospholipase D-like protein